MKLLFVYNAASGRLNGWIDMAHKIVSPSTYECSLCALTHGAFTEKKAWARFRDESGLQMQFLHKDEFEKEYGLSYAYPVILKVAAEPELFMSAEQIGQLATVDALIDRITRLSN